MKGEPNPRRPEEETEKRERSWSLDRLPWPEVARILARDPRLILPVGALIQHGPHLPLGTNTFIVEEVARAVSKASSVLLAPTFHYGVGGWGKKRFPGSSGMERKTLHRAMNELLAEWEDHGIREFFILTAHRHELHLDALLMAMTSSAATIVVNLLAIEVDDLVEASPLDEHGGELETSLMLHLAPHLVRLDQVTDAQPGLGTSRRYAHGGGTTPPLGPDGILGFPSRASAEKGSALYIRYVKSLTEVLSGPEAHDPAPENLP